MVRCGVAVGDWLRGVAGVTATTQGRVLMKSVRGLFGALVLMLSLLIVAQPVFAAPVAVQGNSRVSTAVIQSYFKGTDEASIDQGVADLLATGLFTSVKAENVGGQVVIAVAEGKVIINRVAFEGTSQLKGDQLSVEVQSHDHEPFDEAVAQADIGQIKEAYKKVGRSAVTVTYRTVPLPNGRVDLVFHVDEGTKTGVRQINFVGNQAVSSGRLKGLMQLTEMNFLSFIKTTDVYDPDRLASDEDAIRKYYQRYGYADFRITNTDVKYVDQPDPGYIITISVDEGPQYHLSSVNVVSHVGKIDGATLLPFVTLHTGDVENAAAIDTSVVAITRYLASQGYAFSDVRPHGDRDVNAHTIALTFTVDDGPKVYVERIDIVGNTRTRDFVIRREFDIGEGDPYNHAMIENAERRLNNLGFFKHVHISTRPGTSPDRVIVTVEVEDQPTGSVSLSGGYSTTLGWIAQVAFTETNFLGRGQYLKVSASYGQSSQGWSAAFTEPYFLGQHIAAGFDVYHNEQNQNAYQTYQYWVSGVNLRLGFPITDQFTIGTNYSLYQSKVIIPNSSSDPFNDCSVPIPGTTPTAASVPPLGFNNSCLSNGEASIASKEVASLGGRLTSLAGYTLTYDTLDAHKSPSSGMLLSFNQGVAGLGGETKYIKETFDGRFYYPITDDFTGLIHLQGGQINAFGGYQLLITDNYNLGPTLVRGFAPGGLGPRDLSDPSNTTANALGGTTYYGASAEVQFPIFGLPREVGLRGAVFADTGSLFGFAGATQYNNLFPGLPANSPCIKGNVSPTWTQSNCLTVQDSHLLRISTGLSLLWDSPLGPIRLDYAFVLRKAPGDQTQAFNFSGGASF